MKAKNRRGQIPTLMLVIVAIVLSGAALFSFLTFKGGVQIESSNMHFLVSDIEFREEFVLQKISFMAGTSIKSGATKNIETNLIGLAQAETTDLRGPIIGNYLAKLRTGDFSFKKVNGEYRLEVAGLFVDAESGENSIKRELDLCMVFDEEGRFVEDCEIK